MPSPLVFINPNAFTDEDDVFAGADNTDIPLLVDQSVSIDYYYTPYLITRARRILRYLPHKYAFY